MAKNAAHRDLFPGALEVMILAVDLIQNRVNFQRVVALNILEAVGPRCKVGARI